METKPAVQTTEFWSHLMVQVVALAQLTGVWQYLPSHDNTWVVTAMAIVGGLYATGRGLAKSGVAPTP